MALHKKQPFGLGPEELSLGKFNYRHCSTVTVDRKAFGKEVKYMPNDILIDQLAGGALAEKLNIELRKLAENVLDPNTKATASRTVTATITIKPNEQRQVGAADIVVKASLAPSMGIPSMFVFDFDKEGKAVIKELLTHDPNQLIVNNDGHVADATGAPLGNVVTGKFR